MNEINKETAIQNEQQSKSKQEIINDIIKMKTDTKITDKNGNTIEIKVPRPKYSSEIFS